MVDLNDYGITTMFLLFTSLLSLRYTNIFNTKIKYVYGFLVLSLYKSLCVYKKKENGNKILNFFGKFNFIYLITPYLRIKYDYLRFEYVNKILNFGSLVKQQFNKEYLFMFSNYNNYLDWITGAFQHIVTGILINNNLNKNRYKVVKDLIIFENFYDSIVYFSQILFYIENWKNKENNPDDHIRTFFNTLHFIGVQFSYLMKPDLIEGTKEYLKIYNQLFLTNVGFFMLYMVTIAYILVKIKIKEEKNNNKEKNNSQAEKIRNIVIYVSMAFFYGMYLSKIRSVGEILKNGKIDPKIRYTIFFIVCNIYVYTFYPLILFLFGQKENNNEIDEKKKSKMKRFLSYWV